MGALDDIAKEQLIADYGVGIDCHSRFIQVCVLANRDGTISRLETEYATTWEGLTEAREWILEAITQMGEVRPEAAQLAYCIESTACYHLPVILCFDGQPMVVNPLLANPSRRKTDKLDARLLARHAIIGLWPRSYVVPMDDSSRSTHTSDPGLKGATPRSTSSTSRRSCLRHG